MNRKILTELLEKHRNGTTTPAEEKLLEDWLDAVEQDGAGEDFPVPEKAIVHQSMWQHIAASQRTSPRKLYLRWASIAASIAIIATAGYFVFYQPMMKFRGMTAFHTGIGEIRQVILPDQSKMIIGPNTTLYYTDRHIVIEEGKAFFDVVKNAAHPFTVSTGEVTTTVLGTSFTAEILPGMKMSRISLLTGKVKVADYGVLQPLQRMTVEENKGLAMTDLISAEDALAWTRGEILLRNASLQEVIQALKDNYNLTIKTALNTQQGKYTIRFPAAMPIREVLDVIQKISYKPKIRFTMNKDQLTIY